MSALLSLALSAAAAAPAPSASSSAAKAEVALVQVDSEISLGLAAYVRRAIERAKGAKGVIVRIDTFGGRVDAALEISRALETDGRVVAFVDDKAWSAGALIALSCPAIYMRQGASIGSAAPVSESSDGRVELLGEKYISALRAKFIALAERNHHPAQLAAAMVDKDVEVVKAPTKDGPRFVSPEEAGRLKDAHELTGSTETVSAKGKLLNLSAERAIEYGLAKPAASLEEVLKAEGWQGARLVPVEKTPIDTLVSFLTKTETTSLLVLVGFMLITFELNVPGHILPGVFGVLCLGVVYFGHYLAYLANGWDLLIVVLGVSLVVFEALHFPGHGAGAIPGFLLILLGVYLMLVPFVVPKEPWDFERLRQIRWVLMAAGAGAFCGVASVTIFAIKLAGRRSNGLPGLEGGSPSDKPRPGELWAGQRGRALTPLSPSGRAQFGILLVDVRAEAGTPIARGADVEIVTADGEVIVRASRH